MIKQIGAALVHIRGGAPPTGSELITVKHSNTANRDSLGVLRLLQLRPRRRRRRSKSTTGATGEL
jgi:hypothetical protein